MYVCMEVCELLEINKTRKTSFRSQTGDISERHKRTLDNHLCVAQKGRSPKLEKPWEEINDEVYRNQWTPSYKMQVFTDRLIRSMYRKKPF